MSENIKLSKNIIDSFVKLTKNRNILIFIFFFIIASFLWFLNAINKEYTTDINVPYKLENLPKSYEIRNESEIDINVSIHGHGYNLLREEIERVKHPIVIDLNSKSNPVNIYRSTNSYTKSYILTKELIPFAKKRFGSNLSIVSIKPDTLYLDIKSTLSKKVKLVHDIKYSINNTFMLVGEISLTPDSITVYGPIEILDTLSYVMTSFADLGEIKENNIKEIKIKYNKHLTYSRAKVLVTFPVEKYTEATKEINITPINLPTDTEATLLPKTVIISYKVPLSIYDKINEDDFKVIADYEKSQDNNIEIEVIAINKKIHIIKVQPISINYLLKKNETPDD